MMLEKAIAAVENATAAVQKYLFVDYPRAATLWQTDYFEKEQNLTPEEQKKLREDRFAGYKTLCTFGLGSLFWSGATGVLAGWKDKAGWIEYIFIHSIVTFVLLLNGLVASIFHTTAWFAPFSGGLGSWSALLLFLGTAHIMSLKYHDYETECFYSLVASSVAVTIYWAVSVQDPLPLYIAVKTLFWIVGLAVYFICFVLHKLCGGLKWFIVSVVHEFAWKNEGSIKNRLVGAWTRFKEWVKKRRSNQSTGDKKLPLLSPQ